MVRFCVRGSASALSRGLARGATQVADPAASWGRFTWRSPGRSSNRLSAVFGVFVSRSVMRPPARSIAPASRSSSAFRCQGSMVQWCSLRAAVARTGGLAPAQLAGQQPLTLPQKPAGSYAIVGGGGRRSLMARVPAGRPGAILPRASGSTRITAGGRPSRRAGSLCAGRVITASGALAGQRSGRQSARTCRRGAEGTPLDYGPWAPEGRASPAGRGNRARWRPHDRAGPHPGRRQR